MSHRLVKKVLNQQQFNLTQQQEDEIDDYDYDDDDSAANRSSINPFDLLNDQDDITDTEDQGDDLTSTTETTARYDNKEQSSSKKYLVAVSTFNTKSKKKKKKKKKKSKDSSVGKKTEGEQELDSILKNLSLDVKSFSKESVSMKAKTVNGKDKNKSVKHNAMSILQVDPKYLNAENELKRIFGSKVVKSFESSNQTSSSRQIRGARRGHYNLRKTVLVTPASHWPRWDGSLSMEFLETKNGYNYFKYAHSSSYSQAQAAFEAARAINDLNGLASILLYHPYHLESLLTMAEYFKVVGEQQMSADAIAKCLYAIECAIHPMFTPLQGNCQLKFIHDTNKPMFTVLFTHMKNLDRRGCHRSALEVCKLLLSLESDDPTGAIFCIDYFALRAEEYAWLENFSEYYKSDNSIWLFPNISYSLAICRFYLERESSNNTTVVVDSEKASSSDLMKQALMLHPPVIKKLVAKVPLKDRIWTEILKHAFFRSDQTGIQSQDHLISIYVERNYLIWRLPDLQKLLSDAAQLVIKTLENNKSEVNDWACVRKEAFSSEKNDYGHLLVSDFSDSVSSIPPENLQQFMGDPMMRADVPEGMHDENQFAGMPLNGHVPPRPVANRNALAVLFESMLPWVTYEEREAGEPDGDDQHDGQGQDNQ